MLPSIITLYPDNQTPPPSPTAADVRHANQQAREQEAAIAHKAITDIYGTAGLPSVIPFWWSAAKVEHFARGGEHRTPAFVATVGTRVSASRRRIGLVQAADRAEAIGQMALERVA